MPGPIPSRSGRPTMVLSTIPGQRYRDRTAGMTYVRTASSWDNETDPTPMPVTALPNILNGGYFVGTNAPGGESWFNGNGHFPGYNFFLPDPEQFKYLRSRGVRVLRIPIAMEHIWSTGSLTGPMNQPVLAALKSLSLAANELSMGVIFDLHNYANWNPNHVQQANNAQRNFPQFGDPPRTAVQLAVAGQVDQPSYATVAAATAAFGGEIQTWPGVLAIDTQNEPIGIADIHAYQQTVVNALRAAGFTLPISVESNGFTSAQNYNNANVKAIFGLNDPMYPDPHIIYQVHDYTDCDASGTHGNWLVQSTDPSHGDGGDTCPASAAITVSTGANRMDAFLKAAAAAGVKHIWLGEIGAPGNDQHWVQAIAQVFTKMRNATGFAGHFITYWSGGGGGYTSPDWFDVNAQPLGSQPGNVVDKLQMANIEAATGFTAVPYGITAATPGGPGVTSTRFTVTVHGNVVSPVVITPSDNGAGGRFSPTSVTVPTGLNGSADGVTLPTLTFTYTPPAGDTMGRAYLISATNNGPFVNPAAVVYSTAPDPVGATLTAIGATPVALIADWAVLPSMVNPTMTLRRTLDGATRSFAPQPSIGKFDPVALSKWAGSSSLALVSGVNVANEEKPLQVSTPNGHYPPPSFADQALYSPNAMGTGLGGITMNNTRMSIFADITGASHACIRYVGKFGSSDLAAVYQSPDNGIGLAIPGGGAATTRLAAGDTSFNLGTLGDRTQPKIVRWCFDPGKVTVAVNGVVTQSVVSEQIIPAFNGSYPFGFPQILDLGFFNNYNVAGSGYSNGHVLGALLIEKSSLAPTETQNRAIDQVLATHYGISYSTLSQ